MRRVFEFSSGVRKA